MKGRNRNRRGLWRVETRVTPSVSFSNPPRRRAFWPDGGPECALLQRQDGPQFSLGPYTRPGPQHVIARTGHGPAALGGRFMETSVKSDGPVFS